MLKFTDGWKRKPPLHGPRAWLNCTRKPRFTCVSPLSSAQGTLKMIVRSGSNKRSSMLTYLEHGTSLFTRTDHNMVRRSKSRRGQVDFMIRKLTQNFLKWLFLKHALLLEPPVCIQPRADHSWLQLQQLIQPSSTWELKFTRISMGVRKERSTDFR